MTGGAESSTAYIARLHADDEVFRLSASADAQGAGVRTHARPASQIIAVRPVASVPVRCVEVDNHDHLYLAGQTMIPTHNSTLGLDFARSARSSTA